MKVKDDNERKRVARWLGFARHALNLPVSVMANHAAISRSNLTSFINSGGKAGYVAMETARVILYSVGLSFDGTLSPGLHRWAVTSPECVEAMADIFACDKPNWSICVRLRSGGAFLLARLGALTTVFVSLSSAAWDEVEHRHSEMVGDSVGRTLINLGHDIDSQMHALWMSESEEIVLNHLQALKDLPLAPAALIAATLS